MDKIDTNFIKDDFKKSKPKLIANKWQLPDSRKTSFGFNLTESVIDVEQCGYAISREDDVLFTYGIGPCCGLVLCDENVRVLFHLDGSVTPEDVMEITNRIGLLPNATALFFPGPSCGIPGCFEYKKLEDEYRNLGYKILEQRIPATFGFVTVRQDQITIGTGIDKSLDKSFAIEHKRTQIETQMLGKQSLEEIEDTEFLESLRAEMIRQSQEITKSEGKDK